MIYILLSIVALLILLYFTHVIEFGVKETTFDVSSISISLVFACVECLLLTLVLMFKGHWTDVVVTQVMRFIFGFDGILFVMLTFGFISLAVNIKTFLARIIQVALVVLVFVLVFGRFTMIDVSFEKGIIIQSEYLFGPAARQFFPWTWVTVYTVGFRYLLPLLGVLIMAIKNEDKNTELEKNQTLMIFGALAFMWVSSFIINFIAGAIPAFSLLYMYSYLFMYVVIYSALSRVAVPSVRAVTITLIKFVICYLLPGAIVGAACMYLQPLYSNFQAGYIVTLTFIIAGVVTYAFWISEVLSSSSRFITADYETSLERDLASVDYTTGEMDYIAGRWHDIIKRNTEASSLNVYILNNNELETAYSSNGMSLKIPVNTPFFESLLNINRSIVLFDQIEKEHNLADIRDDLKDFFQKTKSDALFILNEGHNIFGIITLGPKGKREHFKEYDYNVFEKFYSYFFVYGYYMRNISNKEVIGVVNREIKMSSQIITSIQENIDHVKNDKIDTGYMMVPAHNIGGEFIDMIRLTATRHLYVVGDLSGKGIAASMNMVILKSIIRTYLAETHDFKELVVKINSFVRDSLRKGTIFAGLFALVDFETDTMYYINCGIPALMMYTQVYNNVIEIQGSGHVLGFVKDISPYISVKTTKLNRGDIILACTDGLVQSHSLRGESYGKERIQQALLDNSTYNAQRMTQFIFDDLVKFMSKEMEDDVSILVLKYESKVEEQEEFADVDEAVEGADEVPEEIIVKDYVEESESEVIDEPSEDSITGTDLDLPETIVENDKIELPAEDELPTENSFQEEPLEVKSDSLPESIEASVAPLPDEPNLDVDVEMNPEIGEKAPAAEAPAMDMPADPDLPDLSDLDAMLKEAGL